MNNLIFIAILLTAIFAHLATIATIGRLYGVKVRAFSFGFGPTIYQHKAFRVGAFPIGGFVRFRDSTVEELSPAEVPTALNERSTIEQLAITLSGCAALLMVGIVTGHGASFLSFPAQLLAGAFPPFGDAQTLIGQSLSFASTAPFWSLTGTVFAKLAAFNLFPFPFTNGGAALAVIGRRVGLEKFWPHWAGPLLLYAYAALLVSWCLALFLFVHFTWS